MSLAVVIKIETPIYSSVDFNIIKDTSSANLTQIFQCADLFVPRINGAKYTYKDIDNGDVKQILDDWGDLAD